MKFSIIATISLLGSSHAFTPLSSTSNNVARSSKIRQNMSEENFAKEELSSTPVDPVGPIATKTSTEVSEQIGPIASGSPAVALSKMSTSMPFMERPAVLDGSIAGDVGFDPLGFAKTKEDLMNYREAEIKHARLAMLAAAGWPLSELWDWKIAVLFGMPALVDNADRAPSVLNGGLDRISPAYWIGCLLLAGAVEFYGTTVAKKNNPEYFPGNLGFDPLGLYPKDVEEQKAMQLKEIKNGRLAMIAITAFAFQEFVSKIGVIDETPFFFKPLNIGEELHNYANSGYIS